MTYIIIAIIIVVALIFFFASRTKTTGANDIQQTISEDTTPAAQQPKENPYEGLRNMAFSVTPEQLELSLPADQAVVYGVIMDWEMGGATATTVAYQTGDASLYVSTGGGVIGGVQHQNVSSAAKQFVQAAQSYLDKTTKTPSPALPAADEVKFYLLTNDGIFVGQEQMKNFENNSSEWLRLFDEGNKVLTELRQTMEHKR